MAQDGVTTPTFSVIVPTYNRPVQLWACLEALAEQDYPRSGFEVVVVDDGGERALDGVEQFFRDKLSIVLVRQANAGPAAARNRGAHCARGCYIAFTDDDCIPARDWLRRLADVVQSFPDDLCGGHVQNGLPGNVFSTASQTILEAVYVWQKTSRAPHFFTTNNMCVSRQRFLDSGGLSPLFRISEDREFCDRWMHGGGALRYAPEAIVYHKHELSLCALLRQHFDYGRGAFRFYQLRARRGWGGLRVDSGFYLTLFRRALNRPLRQRLPVLGAVLLTQLANTSGYFWEKYRRTAPAES